MTPDRRPCQLCPRPIYGETGINRGIYLNGVRVGERLKQPGIGYGHMECIYQNQDVKSKAAGE